jgi:hypothetical protein
VVEFIETFSGRRIEPLNPKPEQICIEDIAHALSLQCRFTGHVRKHYSVGEHSIRVALLSAGCTNKLGHIPAWDYKSRRTALWGLLHDASEAYLCDIASPVKHQPAFALYREAEARLETIIFEKFGLFGPRPSCIKQADAILCRTEGRDLMPGNDGLIFGDPAYPVEPLKQKIVPHTAAWAETTYLRLFHEWSS